MIFLQMPNVKDLNTCRIQELSFQNKALFFFFPFFFLLRLKEETDSFNLFRREI